MDENKCSKFRNEEFPQLNNILYMDYAGAMPLCSSQVKQLSNIQHLCYTNPHSQSNIDFALADMETLRCTLCDAFNTNYSEYEVIFTHNATSGFQLVGQLFKWTPHSTLTYLLDDHNSVLGFVELSKQVGVSVSYVTDYPTEQIKASNTSIDILDNIPDSHPIHGFIFPFISNFSGHHYPMKWISDYQNSGGIIFLDCSSSMAPNFSHFKPDFAFLSLLKLSGSHGGAILVRRDRISLLKDPVAAGGSVLFSCARSLNYKPLPLLHSRLEGGTQSYQDLSLALTGLRVRHRLGTENELCSHVEQLAQKLDSELRSLKHSNGSDLIKFVPERPIGCSDHNFSFNMYSNDGKMIQHFDVQFNFAVFNIVARFGGHCNPGACFPSLKWEPDEISKIAEENEKKGRCISNLCTLEGRPVGTIRLSLGYTSTNKDIEHLIDHLRTFFIDGGPHPFVSPLGIHHQISMKVKKMFVFPIIGAPGFEVVKWPAIDSGFLFDRTWKLMNVDGVTINTTNFLPLAQMSISISSPTSTSISLSLFGSSIEIPINPPSQNVNISEPISKNSFDLNSNSNYIVPSIVAEAGEVYGKDICEWFQRVTGRWLYLVKVDPKKNGKFPFSSVNLESMNAVGGFDISRLRINMLFEGLQPFEEEGSMDPEHPLLFNGHKLSLWRSRVVCMTTSVDIKTGEIDTEPLKKLEKLRATYGALPFGNLFAFEKVDSPFDISLDDIIISL